LNRQESQKFIFESSNEQSQLLNNIISENVLKLVNKETKKISLVEGGNKFISIQKDLQLKQTCKLENDVLADV
tara:strand:+ start:905 stop:1123 length:219 start_codon:yes stop_codon:yes gene_type:complete